MIPSDGGGRRSDLSKERKTARVSVPSECGGKEIGALPRTPLGMCWGVAPNPIGNVLGRCPKPHLGDFLKKVPQNPSKTFEKVWGTKISLFSKVFWSSKNLFFKKGRWRGLGRSPNIRSPAGPRAEPPHFSKKSAGNPAPSLYFPAFGNSVMRSLAQP